MVLSGVLLVACAGEDGGDLLGGGPTGSGAAPDPYAQAVADSLLDGQDETGLDQETASCAGTAVVDLVGSDAFTAAGITPAELASASSLESLALELPDDAASALAAVFATCDIAEPVVAALVEGLGAEAGGALSADAAICLDGIIDNQAIAAGLAVVVIEGTDEDFTTLLYDAIVACPDVMTEIILSESSGSVGSGSPGAEACVRSVIAAHPDLVRSALAEEPNAVDELVTLILEDCPTFTD